MPVCDREFAETFSDLWAGTHHIPLSHTNDKQAVCCNTKAPWREVIGWPTGFGHYGTALSCCLAPKMLTEDLGF